MNQHPRRLRSPSYSYDPRAMSSARSDYDNPYHPSANAFDGPLAPPPLHGMSSGAGHPVQFIDGPPDYTPNYRTTQRLPSIYRSNAVNRETQYAALRSSRPSSPPYKILCITNINNKIGDVPVKDALASDFGQFGDISVSICHDNGERLVYIYFKSYEVAREARYAKTGSLLFDRPIEIEPIYEPRPGTNGSPQDSSNTPIMNDIYSPNRSISSPPPEHALAMHRRRGPTSQMQTSQEIHHSHIHYNRSSSPPTEYASQPHMYQNVYPHGPSSPLLSPAQNSYDRRSGQPSASYSAYPQPQMTTPLSPYSSPPPPDPYNRSPYHTHPPASHQYNQQNHYNYPAPNPYGPPPSYNLRERDRYENAHLTPRSPHNDLHYPSDNRSPFQPNIGPPYHSLTKGLSHPAHLVHTGATPTVYHPSSSSSYRSSPPLVPAAYHRQVPEPPARYYSREFRREKFGSEHYNNEHDDSKPSRILMVNKIDLNKTESDIREVFEPFGVIEEMEVRKVTQDMASALIKFSSMDAAYKAKTANNGRHIGNLRARIVYGKVTASRKLWMGGLNPITTTTGLEAECSKYGDIISMDYTSGRPYAYIEFKSANQAQFAAHHLKSVLTPAPERKIRIEFVDPERTEKVISRIDSQLAESKARPANNARDPNDQPSNRQKRVALSNDSIDIKRICQDGAQMIKQERAVNSFNANKHDATSHYSGDSNDDLSQENNHSANPNEDSTQSQSISTSYKSIDSPARQSELPNQDRLAQCRTIREIVHACTASWGATITLRNFNFPIVLFMCSGRKQSIDKYMKNCEEGDNNPVLRITQRWRLNPQPKLEEVKRRMQTANHGILIITSRIESKTMLSHSASIEVKPVISNGDQVAPACESSPKDGDQQLQPTKKEHEEQPQQNGDTNNSSEETENSKQMDKSNEENGSLNQSAANEIVTDCVANNVASVQPNNTTQSRPLRNLISYLEQKDAAGVISLTCSDSNHSSMVASDSNSKLLYAFPPCDFALNLIRCKASNLVADVMKEEFLLGVIVGNNDTKI